MENIKIPQNIIDNQVDQNKCFDAEYVRDLLIETAWDEAFEPTCDVFDAKVLESLMVEWMEVGGSPSGDRGDMSDDTYNDLVNKLFNLVNWEAVAAI